MSPRPLPLALLLALAVAPGALAQDLEIHVLNVDQGACAFVRGPGGTRVLVDAGSFGLGPTITGYLSSIGVTDLDYSILTSFDADHCGGMDEVFDAGWRPNVAAWDRGDFLPKGTNQENQYKASAGALRHLPVVGETISLGGGATIECVAVNGQHATGTVPVVGTAQEENALSLAVVVRHGDFEFYIGGDLTSGGNGTADVEGPVSQNVGRVDAMQMSHHGSNTSSGPVVVANFDPSFVAISAGVNAGYGHPTKTVCNQFNTLSNGRPLMCTTRGNQDAPFPTLAGGFTAANGTFVLRSDGTGFTVTAPGGNELAFTCHENPGATPTAGDLVITELLVDPVAALDATGDWFELTNVSGGDLDLFGCKVRSGGTTFTIDSHVVLRPDEYLVVGLDGVPQRNGGLFVDLCAPWEQFSLANGTSFVEVLTPSFQSIDRVDWGGAGVPVQPGVAKERIDRFAPSTPANFTNAVSVFGAGDLGTPGEVNDADQPPVLGTTLTQTAPAQIGSTAQFLLSSPGHPGAVYILNLSSGVFPGINYLGVHLPLNLDAAFLNFLFYPGFFGNLDFTGKRTVSMPIPNNPSLVGSGAFFAFILLQYDFVGGIYLPLAASNALFVPVVQ